MKICERINQIIDISELPKELYVSNNYEVALVSSTWRPEFSYISDNLLCLITRDYGGSTAEMADVGLMADGKRFFINECVNLTFDKNTISGFFEKTGLHFFVLYFTKNNSFFIGLDLDFVLIVSEKLTGFIALNGGRNTFRQLNWEIFKNGESGMNEKTFRTLDQTVYDIK